MPFLYSCSMLITTTSFLRSSSWVHVQVTKLQWTKLIHVGCLIDLHIFMWTWWKKQRNLGLLHFSISFQNHFAKSLLKTGRLHQYSTSTFSVCHLETVPLVVVMPLCSAEKKTNECTDWSHNYFVWLLIARHQSKLWEEYFIAGEGPCRSCTYWEEC